MQYFMVCFPLIYGIIIKYQIVSFSTYALFLALTNLIFCLILGLRNVPQNPFFKEDEWIVFLIPFSCVAIFLIEDMRIRIRLVDGYK